MNGKSIYDTTPMHPAGRHSLDSVSRLSTSSYTSMASSSNRWFGSCNTKWWGLRPWCHWLEYSLLAASDAQPWPSQEAPGCPTSLARWSAGGRGGQAHVHIGSGLDGPSAHTSSPSDEQTSPRGPPAWRKQPLQYLTSAYKFI